MRVSFANEEVKRLYEKGESIGSRYPAGIIERYVKRIDLIRAAETFNDLYAFTSSKFEKIDHNRYSMRINDQYRIEMTYESMKDGTMLVKVFLIQKISKHYRKG